MPRVPIGGACTMLGQIDPPKGWGKYKIASFNVAVTGTATIDTGFNQIHAAQVTVMTSSDSIPTSTASVTGITEPNVSVVVTEHQAAANAVSTTEHFVNLLVIGYCHAEPEIPT